MREERIIKIRCVIGLIIIVCELIAIQQIYSKRASEKFRANLAEELDSSITIIYLKNVGSTKKGIMDEVIASYNKENEEYPMIQYTAYQMEKNSYVLISYLNFLQAVAGLKIEMWGDIRTMEEHKECKNYEYTFIYATDEQKELYDNVISQFGELKELLNFQEVKKEGIEATKVTISFENPFAGRQVDALHFLFFLAIHRNIC